MTLHLIRHGRTAANDQKLYCGKADLPLSESGGADIAALAASGLYPRAGAYFTSGLLRARQTLALIYGYAAAEALPGLSEFDFGGFELLSYEQLKEEPAYIAWITDETGDVCCPGGESRNIFAARVCATFDALCGRLEQSHVSSSVLVCHGGTIVQIMDRLRPNEKHFYEWQPAPGRGYSLVFQKGKLCRYKPI